VRHKILETCFNELLLILIIIHYREDGRKLKEEMLIDSMEEQQGRVHSAENSPAKKRLSVQNGPILVTTPLSSPAQSVSLNGDRRRSESVPPSLGGRARDRIPSPLTVAASVRIFC